MRFALLILACTLSASACAQKKAEDTLVKRGRYLVQIGGCNDCHTPHYPEMAGKGPEAEWLTGDALG